MTSAQGSVERHAAFTHSPGFARMKGMRAEVARDKLLQVTQLNDTGDWHFLCPKCKDSIAPLTKGAGLTYTLSELLSCAVAHYVQKHEEELTYERYGEDYA